MAKRGEEDEMPRCLLLPVYTGLIKRARIMGKEGAQRDDLNIGMTELGNPSYDRVTLTTHAEKDFNSGLLQRGRVKKGLNSGLS